MDMLTAHRSALRQFDRRVAAVRPTQWAAPTPDADWDVRALVGHLVAEQWWVAPLLAGHSVAEAEPIAGAAARAAETDDPAATWAAAAAAAWEAWAEPGVLERTVQLSAGPTPAEEYGWQMTLDLTVHAWDLARATGGPDDFPNDLVSTVLDRAKASAADWQGTGLFAPSIPVPGCTDDLTELLALLGRNRWWRS
ncbi:TIGR03086 family protein [Nakamurella flavida]|uniref:TIGR03086 family protein n=1 Tax=Nakamurella flavida TaxID=363630 RepID=A0A938YPW8_9ACTN|nr:TIGR03086 family metal-binding protein [Nakamurella flavida]MBM9477053.1 TIGR03086 family protein [Nakamurella flavida]MDP9779999.1 uncharacterized protein (TIGR03086 family) [Nakamurella flavida]